MESVWPSSGWTFGFSYFLLYFFCCYKLNGLQIQNWKFVKRQHLLILRIWSSGNWQWLQIVNSRTLAVCHASLIVSWEFIVYLKNFLHHLFPQYLNLLFQGDKHLWKTVGASISHRYRLSFFFWQLNRLNHFIKSLVFPHHQCHDHVLCSGWP